MFISCGWIRGGNYVAKMNENNKKRFLQQHILCKGHGRNSQTSQMLEGQRPSIRASWSQPALPTAAAAPNAKEST